MSRLHHQYPQAKASSRLSHLQTRDVKQVLPELKYSLQLSSLPLPCLFFPFGAQTATERWEQRTGLLNFSACSALSLPASPLIESSSGLHADTNVAENVE